MEKQTILLTIILCSFNMLGSVATPKDIVKFSGEFLFENIRGNWKDYKFHTQSGRTRLWANANINDDWKYTAMLENT